MNVKIVNNEPKVKKYDCSNTLDYGHELQRMCSSINDCWMCPIHHDSDGRVQLYRRPDLSEWAAKAAADGERYFYVEAVNPNINGGKLRLCCPKYEYRVDSLTQEEYDALKELLKGDD